MKLLLSSDWQTDNSNVDLCEQSLDELLAIAHKEKPDAIIHAGDLKEQYDPVGLRVVKFWVRAVRRIISEGFDIYILAGNHDRLSQSHASKNWLDVLRAAGAKTVSNPSTKKIGDGWVSFLPYTPDKKQEREWAIQLAEATVSRGPRALVFHTEVAGASLNSFGTKAIGNDVADLRFNTYTGCFGGHLHGHQQIAGNGWYIGSPFCQDWGDANQSKGHVLATFSDHVDVKQFRTAIPHWYTTEYLESKGTEPEAGSYIRSKVPVTSKKISVQLRNEEERIRLAFPASADLRLFVIPQLQASQKLEVELTGESDLQQVEQYVSSTIPEQARFVSSRVVRYLVSKLAKIAPGPQGKRVRFLYTEFLNTLCFPKIKIRYHNQGLVLLRGVNRDWPRRSNGAGKTSALSLLTVALSGQTPKGQKNDSWASEANDDPAVGKLVFKDERGRRFEVIRGRRPHKLLLLMDGEDISTGLTGKGKTETQGLIESFSGFDLRMLLNSVYIDQTIANGFVFGTQKDRMDLVSKLCSLERYEAALKLVVKDITANQKATVTENSRIDSLEEAISRSEDELVDVEKELGLSRAWEQQIKAVHKEIKLLVERKSSYSGSVQHYQELQDEVDTLSAELVGLEETLNKHRSNTTYWAKRRDTFRKLAEQGKCMVCEQATTVSTAAVLKEAEASAKVSAQKWAQAEETIKAKEAKIERLEAKITHYQETLTTIDRDLKSARELLSTLQQSSGDEEKRLAYLAKKQGLLTQVLRRDRRLLKASRSRIKELDVDRELLEYSQKAFHRSGMPMYLAASLCPLLNRSAEEYSEIFTDGKIKINNSVVDGEFQVSIINPSGSEHSGGQSVGESAMAGIITAFAVREASPKTNLLILDEPGSGLDPEGAKQFAKGLLKLKDRFETIIVTTHSPIIEGILAGETTWTVTKQNGISSLSYGTTAP